MQAINIEPAGQVGRLCPAMIMATRKAPVYLGPTNIRQSVVARSQKTERSVCSGDTSGIDAADGSHPLASRRFILVEANGPVTAHSAGTGPEP